MGIKEVALIQPLGRGRGTHHGVAFLREKHFKGLKKGTFIINDENSFGFHVISLIGRIRLTFVPCGFRRDTLPVPPWASMIRFTLERPRPVPLFLLLKKGSKT
jgi:hypothetical protein